MPANKSKNMKRRTTVKDLPKRKKDLSREEQKNVKGGLLPYIEQDNLYNQRT